MKAEYIQFKLECETFLSGYNINVLRAYGRKIGVDNPTKKNKPDLVKQIVGILSGELKPIERTLRGAPIKNDYVDPSIDENIEFLRHKYFGVEYGERPLQSILRGYPSYSGGAMLSDANPDAPWDDPSLHSMFYGQLQTIENVACLLPVACGESMNKSVIIPVDLIRQHDLREGDVVHCKTRKMQSGRGEVAYKVLKRNGISIESDVAKRIHFEEEEVTLPTRSICFFDNPQEDDVILKSLEWLTPIRKGQRACIISPPKAGKTRFLYQAVKGAMNKNPDLITYVLLVEQTPETITQFRAILPADQIMYTTYEDEPEDQVFSANLVLKRAIRSVESGHDVLLVVDSFNALADAFNNTEDSVGGKVLAGGLESKTVQYLKKYLGTARALKKGKSLTIVGALSRETGNVADDVICAELSQIANLEIHLDGELSMKRIYPAIDFMRTRFADGVLSDSQNDLDVFLRAEFLPQYGNVALLKALKGSTSFNALFDCIKK